MALRSLLKWFGGGAVVLIAAGSANAQNSSHLMESEAACASNTDCQDALSATAQAVTKKCQDAGCTSCTIALNDRVGANPGVARARIYATGCKIPPAGSANVGLQRAGNLSPAEMQTECTAQMARMEQASRVVQRQLGAAREARDVVKTLCLNDKLSQMDVARRSVVDRCLQVQAAAQRNDKEVAGHNFTIATVQAQRSQQLAAEANQCIGE